MFCCSWPAGNVRPSYPSLILSHTLLTLPNPISIWMCTLQHLPYVVYLAHFFFIYLPFTPVRDTAASGRPCLPLATMPIMPPPSFKRSLVLIYSPDSCVTSEPSECIHVSVSFLLLWKKNIPEINNLKRRNIYFDSWHRGLSPWYLDSIALGPVVRK